MKKVIALVMVLVFAISLCACSNDDDNGVDWPTTGLGAKLPKPDSGKFEVNDFTSSVMIDVKDITKTDFTDYVAKCKSNGFTVDSKEESDEYAAFNEAGEKLTVSYTESLKKFSIDIEESKINGTITWPVIGLAALVPDPGSTKGNITSDSEGFFFAYIGGMSKDAYNDYVNQCTLAGFDVDYNKGDDFYFADNSDGVSLSLRFEGFDTMSVRLELPDEESETETETAAPVETETVPSIGEVDPEFKAVMDSYETFFKEYCDILKKYAANPTDATLIADYAQYTAQYTETMAKLNEIEEDSLGVAELAYYTEVNARISKMLLEAGI